MDGKDLGQIGAAETWLNLLTEMRDKRDAAVMAIEQEHGITFDDIEKTIKTIAVKNLTIGDSIDGQRLQVVIRNGAERWNTEALNDMIKKDPSLKHQIKKRGEPYAAIVRR